MTKSIKNATNKPPLSRGKRWFKEAIMMLIVFLVISLGLDIWRSQNMPTDKIPALIMQSTHGDTVDLVARSHKAPVMVYFWGTWCSVCRFVSPTINWLDDNHDVISVAVNSGDNKRLNGYLKHHGYQFETINDNRSAIMKAWGVSAVPTVIILKDGKVKSITTGFSTPPGLWFRMLVAK
ncbi:protein disulfide oxidoreductase [Photobacterium nomapromontoriensis]|uniref:protein disulfide oxidoreductase n=1 Tax=Photobacterium nomapromontoriensis TaxID=2910237 RepID=UPI003D0D7617